MSLRTMAVREVPNPYIAEHDRHPLASLADLFRLSPKNKNLGSAPQVSLEDTIE